MKYAVLALAMLLAAGCSSDTNSTYNYSSVGTTANISYGVIADIRIVKVKSKDTGVGTLAGAGAGGVLGSMLGGGTRAHVAGALGGALIGGIAGNQTEKALSGKTATQFIIEKDDGSTIAVIQSNEKGFRIGDSVMIIQGGETHLEYDNRR